LVLTVFYPTLNIDFIPPVSKPTVRVYLRELLDAKRLNGNYRHLCSPSTVIRKMMGEDEEENE
jgi:hypothetical protein